jgi:hypothetical protein
MRLIKNFIKLKETPLPDEWKSVVTKASQPNEDKVFNVNEFSKIINKELTNITLDIDGKKVRITTLVGLGSSRIVYEVTSGSQVGTVYKFALNEKGLAQNKNELNITSDSDVKVNPLIVKPIDFDNNSFEYEQSGNPLWIQYEKLNIFNSPSELFDIWLSYFGFTFRSFSTYLLNIGSRVSFPDDNQKTYKELKELIILLDRKLIPKNMKESEYAENVFISHKESWNHLVNFLRIVKKYDLLIGDIQMQAIANWPESIRAMRRSKKRSKLVCVLAQTTLFWQHSRSLQLNKCSSNESPGESFPV